MKSIFTKDIKVGEVVERIKEHECLICWKNLDKDIGPGKWHIPLCKIHRRIYLEDVQDKIKERKNKDEKSNLS